MPADVFISYHTDSAGEAVDKIAIALESAGIKCWYAPRNVEGNYAGSITKAISPAEAMISLNASAL